MGGNGQTLNHAAFLELHGVLNAFAFRIQFKELFVDLLTVIQLDLADSTDFQVIRLAGTDGRMPVFDRAKITDDVPDFVGRGIDHD